MQIFVKVIGARRGVAWRGRLSGGSSPCIFLFIEPVFARVQWVAACSSGGWAAWARGSGCGGCGRPVVAPSVLCVSEP